MTCCESEANLSVDEELDEILGNIINDVLLDNLGGTAPSALGLPQQWASLGESGSRKGSYGVFAERVGACARSQLPGHCYHATDLSISTLYLHRMCMIYRIRPNFRGTQFSRIAIFKHFAETIFADHVSSSVVLVIDYTV